jgi:hypothetical protein
MQEFMNLLEEQYELYLYDGPRMNSGLASKCIAILVDDPEKVIRDIKRRATARKIQMPEVSFLDIRKDKYVLYWSLDEE